MSFINVFENEKLINEFSIQSECPLICLSHNGLIQAANLFAQKIFKFDSKNYIGINFHEFCKKNGYSLSDLIDQNNLLPNNSLQEIYLVHGVRHHILWKIIKLSKTENTEEEKESFVIVGSNLTVNSAVEKLKDTVSFYKNILSKLPTNVYWKDKNLIYRGCNDRLAKVMGLPSREAINGMTDFDFNWGEGAAESFIAFDKKVMETGESLTVEDVFKEAEGKIVTVLTNKTPLKDKSGETVGVLAISVDITDKKKAEKELRLAKEKAEAANEAKSVFIANMSHDLRTPLAGLLGMAQMIQSCSTDEEIRYDASLLITCAEELLNLFNEIIELVQIESGKIEHKEEVFSLLDLIQHNKDLLIPATKHKQIVLETRINNNVPDYIDGSKILLDRILLNLLSNAIKFTETGSIILTVNSLEPKTSHERLEFIIEDTGIGIPEDKLEIIFENFSRISPSYKGLYKGSGLGLYTVKCYLKALGGDIRVESKLGEGTRFIVTLPIRRSKKLKMPQGVESGSALSSSALPFECPSLDANEGAESTRDRIAILLVEDQYIAGKMAIDMLKKLHCTVDYANSGEEALNRLKENNYDVIYMDMGLPGIDGLETTRRIRTLSDPKKANIPIVGLTAHMAEDRRNECFAAGLQEMLTKPLTLLAAEAIIRQYVYHSEEPVISEDNYIDIDMEEGANLASGNEALAKELLDILAQSLPDEVQKIKRAYLKKDWDALYDRIHYLYGSFCYCGVPKLRKTGKSLHEASQKKNEVALRIAYQAFCDSVDQFLGAYEKSTTE